MQFARGCGVLLHPTSLPSNYGIGSLGKCARDFVDFLYDSKQKYWQILPINPVGFGESPYQCLSAFAGNELLISLSDVVDQGWLAKEDLENSPSFAAEKVEFSKVKEFKDMVLRKAFENFREATSGERINQFVEKNSYWLRDYALFRAAKTYFKGAPWNSWDEGIRKRKNDAINFFSKELAEEIEYHYFLQYCFFMQFKSLKDYCLSKGIKLIGDLPIYISYDSSEVWANPQLVQLDKEENPIKVAGVPPDYFSETGQLWGNPIYNWDEMDRNDFGWWKSRINNLLEFVHIVRIDHFRGFEAYWEIPFGETTAINGQWVKAPGEKLFNVLKREWADLPIIAEDLGLITLEVKKLKDKFDLPGMKVMQFSFESKEEEEFLPHYHEENLVVYTGTHDNDTILGWYQSISKKDEKLAQLLKKYFLIDENMNYSEICWSFIEIAYQSNAHTVIIPLQDILALDNQARMNLPGTIDGNWQWRYKKEDLTDKEKQKLQKLTFIYQR